MELRFLPVIRSRRMFHPRDIFVDRFFGPDTAKYPEDMRDRAFGYQLLVDLALCCSG
jgi:hypothetical protein